MGYWKQKRPLDVRTPGSNTASATADSGRLNTLRRNYEHYQVIGSASSAGTTIGPRGIYSLQAPFSSAGATSPAIMYIADPTSGDELWVSVRYAAASSNTIQLRTSSSGTFIGSTGLSSEDAISFAFPAQSVHLVALSSNQWLALSQFSTTATGSSAAPALVVSST